MFDAIFQKAQDRLRDVFGMELVELTTKGRSGNNAEKGMFDRSLFNLFRWIVVYLYPNNSNTKQTNTRLEGIYPQEHPPRGAGLERHGGLGGRAGRYGVVDGGPQSDHGSPGRHLREYVVFPLSGVTLNCCKGNRCFLLTL